ncbi:MAG: ParB/RepB/Spo0J family partition protein, partial [Verrucomicrobia bacterium]|nr:ParB/RepB/Spo0J family partition protein [Verrucomicrobiota bacterium]
PQPGGAGLSIIDQGGLGTMATTLKERLARQAKGGSQLNFDPAFQDEPRLVFVPLNCLEPDPQQPRKNLGDLTELAASIREQGLIQPLIVEAIALGRYRLIAGERRWAASRQVGLETVPCLVRTVAEHARVAVQLIENLHRQNLHPLEEAQAFQRLMTEFNLTQRDLAQRLGKSLTSVNETLRLLELSPALWTDVRTSEQISKSVLLEIAKERDEVTQRALLDKAQAGQLTVREARTQQLDRPPDSKRPTSYTMTVADAQVVIRFQHGKPTPERVKAALEKALASCQSSME